MKYLIILILTLGICGCSRSFWLPDVDKAETERAQKELLNKEIAQLTRIADVLEWYKKRVEDFGL